MNCFTVKTEKQIKQFKKFRHDLYKGDPYYVSTVEFTVDTLLHKTSKFARECIIIPKMVEDGGKIVAECMLIKYKYDDFVQISYFESMQGCHDAVRLLKREAEEFAKQNGVNRIIVGLCGHLSYGVGMSLDMDKPNTFDSSYTKTYYTEYFADATAHRMVAFKNSVADMRSKIKPIKTDLVIRPVDFDNFARDMAYFKTICDQTIGTTFLYSNTEDGHFEELLGEMKFFLEKQNLLLAFDGDEVVGFIFWHPDYNEILKKGKQNSLLSIAVRYTLLKGKIKTVKLNSIGVKEKYRGSLTINLLCEMNKYVDQYENLETNFVWENNKPSMLINKHLVKNEARHFAVYEYKLW